MEIFAKNAFWTLENLEFLYRGTVVLRVRNMEDFC